MRKIIHHTAKHTKAAAKHLKKHWYKYLIWAWALFAVKSMFSLLLGLSLFSFHTSADFSDPAAICSGVTEIPESECVALLNIYNDTNWDSWNNTGNRWNTGSIESRYWVSCASGHVSQIYLWMNNLSGVIDLSSLSELTSLNLYNNNLSSIDLSSLSELTSLNLDNNNLSEIDLSSLSELTSLNLDNNNLSEIDLSSLSELTSLNLDNNNLSSIDLSSLSGLTQLYLYNNNLSEIDLSSLSELTKLSLNNNNLTDILWLTGNINISRWDIRYNYLSSDWITNNESFLTSHNINYSPQNDIPVSYDDQWDFSITGELFNKRHIYSGTLLVFNIEWSYQWENTSNGTLLHVGVPIGFTYEDPFNQNNRQDPSIVYGWPGDGCYADFVQGTGKYIAHINTLLDTAMAELVDCSAYPWDFCTVTLKSEDPEDLLLPLDHSDEIVASSGMTARSWTLVDVFAHVGKEEASDQVQTMLLSGVAPATILSQMCGALWNYDLNQCSILWVFFENDLWLDEVPNCGAKVYTSNEEESLYNNQTIGNLLMGRYSYTPWGSDIHMFISSEKTMDTDISNNMYTLHVDLLSWAGINCINAAGYMQTTHGEISQIYVSTEWSCEPRLAICVEGDIYDGNDDEFTPITNNDYHFDASCTTPTLPVVQNLSISGNLTLWSQLLGIYNSIYDNYIWQPLGASFTKNIHQLVLDSNNVPYILVYNWDKNYSIQQRSGGNWQTLGNSFPNIHQLVLDSNNVPHILVYNWDNNYSIQQRSGGNWQTLGDSFSSINQLVLDSNNIPYINIYNWDNRSIQQRSGGNWQPLGDSFIKINKLVLDSNNVPYISVDDWSKNRSIQQRSGGNWQILGNSFPNINELVFDSNNVPYISVDDWSKNRSIQQRSGGNWQPLGDSFSSINQLVFDSNNIPYILVYNWDNNHSIQQRSGGNWQPLGDSFIKIKYLALDSNNVPCILDGISIQQRSGNTWQTLGTPSSAEQIDQLVLDSNNIPYVVSYGKNKYHVERREKDEWIYSYQRYRNNQAIHGATNISYTLTANDINTTIKFEVSPSSKQGFLWVKQSAELFIPQQQTNNWKENPWSGPWPQRDICEYRDCSNSYYDGICGICDKEDLDEQKQHGSPELSFLIQDKELFNKEVAKTKASTSKNYSDELIQAYVFARDIGITTKDTIVEADLEWTLIRSHMAKMISNFAVKTLQAPINTWRNCNFSDTKNQSQEMQEYAKLACQLWLMGLQSDGTTPMKDFDPNGVVTRAQFGTILSRMLRGTQYEWGDVYYSKHLNALKQAEIMKKIEQPTAKELRGRTMLMLMRVFEKEKQQ